MDETKKYSDEEEIDLLGLIKIFTRNIKFIFFFTFSVVFLTGAVLLFKPKEWKAESAILLSGIKTEVIFEPRIQMKEEFQQAKGDLEIRRKTIEVLLKNSSTVKEILNQISNNFEDEKKDIESFVKGIKFEFEGEIIKIKVKSNTPQKAKNLADKWVDFGTKKMNELFKGNMNQMNIETKIKEAKNIYDKSNREYSYFIKNNRVLFITKELDNLKNMYGFYKDNIIGLEKLTWQAKAIKQQIENSTDVGISNLSNQLALLKFKSTVFAGGSELPLKFEIPSSQTGNFQITSSDIKLIIEDLKNLMKLFDDRKKEFQEILEKEKFEEKIQELETKLNFENIRKTELEKNKNLALDSLATLERKKEELSISKDIQDNVFVKIAYYSELPVKSEPRGRLTIILITFVLCLFSSTFFAFTREKLNKIIPK